MREAADFLKKGFGHLGITSSEIQLNQFLVYLSELKKWSRAYNLTGLKTDRDIIVKHFLDSLLFLRAVPPDALSVADIGSGAGFPGIPIKIMAPGLRMSLVEPVGKKAVFLRHISAKLGLQGIEIIDKRIEEAIELRVDVAMTRALFTVRDFIEKARGHINKGGVLILSKGPKFKEEIKDLGMYDIAVSEQKLPIDGTVRYLVVVKNVEG